MIERDFDAFLKQLLPVVKEKEYVPLRPELIQMGLKDLADSITYHGGRRVIVEMLEDSGHINIEDGPKPFGFWKERENVKKELLRVVNLLGYFPSWIDLNKHKEHALVQGIRNYHGGTLTSFREEMGCKPKSDVRPTGYWTKWKNMRGELEAVTESLGHFPSSPELEDLGRSDVLGGLKYHGGIIDIRSKMGYGRVTAQDVARENRIRELEARLEEPLEDYLRREYVENRTPIAELSEELGVAFRTVSDWLGGYKIPVRSISEARLPLGFKKPTKKQLRTWYVTEKKSTADIGAEIGISSHTVGRMLKEHDIPIRDTKERAELSRAKRPSRTALKKDYVDDLMSREDIGVKYSVSSPTVSKWIHQYGIPIPRMVGRKMPEDFVEPTKRQLETWYVKDEKTAQQIANNLDVSKHYVLGLLEKNGIERRANGVTTQKNNPGKRALKRLYLTERKSPSAIGEECGGVSAPTVKRWLTDVDIPLRGYSEARMKHGGYRPSNKQLRQWYVDEERTTVDIADQVKVSDVAIGAWLKEAGIALRDRRGIYDDRTMRLKTVQELLAVSDKKPEDINTRDFQISKRSDGCQFSGLLGWYKRNNNCGPGEARDKLIEDLFGIKTTRVRKKRFRLEPLKDWANFYREVTAMFAKHSELNNELPSDSDWFGENGYHHILCAATQLHGGMPAVREKLGQKVYRVSNGYWKNRDTVVKELERIVAEHSLDQLPSAVWLDQHGYSSVSNAIGRYHGGFSDFYGAVGSNFNFTSEKEQLEGLLGDYVNVA